MCKKDWSDACYSELMPPPELAREDRVLVGVPMTSRWDAKRNTLKRHQDRYASRVGWWSHDLDQSTFLKIPDGERYSKHRGETNEVFLKKMKERPKAPFDRKAAWRKKNRKTRRTLQDNARFADADRPGKRCRFGRR